ncbi:MAG: hypothetical protein R3Y54_08520 [Eubacteriales bacterium]
MQCQHYLAVTGYDVWYLAVLILGKEFQIHKIERDEELIENLITIEKKFWEEHILARVVPLPDGSSNYTELIGKQYGIGEGEKRVDLSCVESKLNRREELLLLEEKMKIEKEQIDQEIKMMMQDATIGNAKEFYITWKNTTTNRLDTKRLKEENPKLYLKYLKTSKNRRFMVRKTEQI